MNLTLTFPALIASATFLVLALTVGRWIGRLNKMIELHDSDILSLRKSRHEHGEKIFVLETRAEAMESDVGDLKHGRRWTDTDPDRRAT